MPREANINQPTKGMNLDLHPMNLDGAKNYYKAFNARQESIDGEQLALTNETGNIKCLDFKSGYKVMGTLTIPERNQTYYWLTNDTQSEIGVSDTSLLDPCNYTTILTASVECLGYTTKTPIHKTDYKITNKTFELYWTDGKSPMKWVDLLSIPKNQEGFINCNRIKIFPDFKVPCIHIEEEVNAGSLKAGSYQFLVAYANSRGEELSQYYAATDAAGVWENVITNRLDFETSKALKIVISNLDTSFSYIKIAVIKTINLTSEPVSAGTFGIEGNSTFEYLYTGNNQLETPLTSDDVFFRYPFYSRAETMTTQNNMLMFGGLTEEEIINYQPIVNKIKGYWEEWRLPVNQFESYNNGPNTANLRSNMRDELYAYELAFIHRSGRQSYAFHWPGPGVRSGDRILVNNQDASNITTNPCAPGTALEKWQVYNTAYVIEEVPEYTFAEDKKCYKGPYRYGECGSWESILEYPNNPAIWGELAGQKIRHWLMPDCSVSPIHDNAGLIDNFEHAVYPLGMRIDMDSVYEAIKTSDLTQEQKDDIIGIKVLRANRAPHKSIVGKGLIFNVGKYTRDNQEFLYPNYPYNDLNPDVFIASRQVDQKSGANVNLRLKGFDDATISKTRYTIHSPDMSFVRPPVSGYLKLETAEFGKAKAHIVEVQNNAKYTMGTRQGLQAALAIGLVSIMGYEAGFPQATVSLRLENFLPTYSAATDLLKKLIPYRQYGYQYTSIGNYSESKAIPNEGNKIRRITQAKYLDPGIIAVEGDPAPINNFQRESSVYLKINEQLPFPHEVQDVPVDNSRFTKSSILNTELPSYEELKAHWNSFTTEERRQRFNCNGSADNFPTSQFYSRDYDTMMSFPLSALINACVIQDYIANVTNGGLTGVSPTPYIKRNISAYYASVKKQVIDQYGQIYSYRTIDTGFCYFFDPKVNSGVRPPTIFGGDTFINRFGLKRKLPFFIANTVGQPDDTDIFYDQLGNVGYPIYYLSTGPKEYTPSQNLINKLQSAYNRVTDTSFSTGLGAALSGGLTRFIPAMTALIALVQEIVGRIGVKNNNLDQYQNKGFWEEGLMYLFAYGIPYFFVESDINIDYRQAENGLERNFYPNVGTDIPDFWLQEKNVSINFDNYYYYNKSLSKQNTENAFIHLPVDFIKERDAIPVRDTRVIYSQPSNLEEKQNNWLIFKANNYYDFPLTNGKLVDLNAVESEKVLARFENNSSLYNAYITLDTSNKTSIVSSGSMFTNPPIEFSKTDIGYTGTQHKNFNSTKYGHFWVDAKRGNVFLMDSGGGLKDISQEGMKNWFKENLPFKITKHYKDVNIDNSFTGIGLTSTWDNKYDRYFLTKKDYVPLSSEIEFNKDTQEFMLAGNVVQLTDKRYFCDASWTVAYSPMTQSWISFYSFVPDYYIEQNGYFQSGKNDLTSIWSHTLRDEEKNYQTFYGKVEPFEIHTVTKTSVDFQVLQSVQYRNDVFEYFTPYERVLKKGVSFDSCVVYNVDQTSGNLDLIMKNKNDMRSGLFSSTKSDSIEVSLAEADQIYKVNQFYNLAKDNSGKPIVLFDCANTIERINPEAVDYKKNNQLVKSRLRSDWFKIKLANNKETRYKFIFKWLLDKSIKSYR